MRLWSIHPKYLDAKGLVACWREALLAKAVLSGKTKGYKRHPQLQRFRSHASPIGAIHFYLHALYKEAVTRGYNFNGKKAGRKITLQKIPVTSGQVRYEFTHLKRKLQKRDRKKYLSVRKIKSPKLHPLFERITGTIEDWERAT